MKAQFCGATRGLRVSTASSSGLNKKAAYSLGIIGHNLEIGIIQAHACFRGETLSYPAGLQLNLPQEHLKGCFHF
jgi:hypothetical protein